MKYSKKIILIIILTLMILPLFLIPRTAVAQEWTYDGVNTEKIPEFSVYPSEWYLWNYSAKAGWVEGEAPPGNYTICEIIKGNITDIYMGWPDPANGTSVYVDLWMVNATSGEKSLPPGMTPNYQLIWWNASAPQYGLPYWSLMPLIIPVASDGKVSEDILINITSLYEMWFGSFGITYTDKAIYPNRYSFHYWNSTDYLIANYTSYGILKKLDHTYMSFRMPNVTLISEPAQKAPDFDITTEHDTLTVNSTEFKLNITIADADNNNDGEVDTDYLYRIQNGTEWSEWADPPNLLDWDLGDVEEGSYDITVEVKNMYGVSQEEITIEYELPPKKKREIIPSYPIAMISIIVIFSISIIIHKYRKKLRL